ncbi:MAG: Hsp20/alpha crystallin family protein [Opitutaceae bacterium]|nr:Hsp20/alpha crystallin family protein [Cephaloticoccus sp.]MCP5529049.1 Hsp20/alpha crystallin family protein [Opitutaceae bacterium]
MSFINNLLPTLRREPVARNESNRSSGPVQKPVYRVHEAAEAYTLTVQLPGVAKGGVEITADDGEIRITGRRDWKRPEAWTTLHRESVDATYELVLTHDNAIDADKVAAELRDGVLTVTVPKAEAIKPRRITVA